MIDTIFLDLDNTILDFNRAEKAAAAKTLIQLGIEPKEHILARYSQLNLMQWKLLEQGELTRDQVKIRRYMLLFREIGSDAPPQKAAELYEGFLKTGHYFMPGAEALLQSLFLKYRLYLVTNGTAAVQKSRIQSAGIAKYFKNIFISEEIGLHKPDREYFAYCFSLIPNFQKSRALIVGDSLTSDIQGGINAGIQTVWFHSPDAPKDSPVKADYEICSLAELEPLLERLP